MSEIGNAKIISTHLGNESHGILSFMVQLDYGGSVQGFGGYDLRHYGIKPVLRILEVVGAETWESLIGKPCRARVGDGWNGTIEAIGHYLEDRWYDIKAEGGPL